MSTAAARHRLSRRLIRHHLGLGVVSVALCAAVIAILPEASQNVGLSWATAYVGLAFLAVTLVIGPLNVLRGQRGPLSDDLRRDIGFWAAVLGVVHVIFGIQIHMGSPWLYFFYGPDERPLFARLPVRIDVFGVANDTGLLATLILVLLLLISNDLSMRKFGNRWWKRLQQLNYALLGLTVVHGILYQRIGQREPSWTLLFWFLWLTAVALQMVGFRIRSARVTGRGPKVAPADLAESAQ